MRLFSGQRSNSALRNLLIAANVGAAAAFASSASAVTIVQNSSTSWTIDNGALQVVYNPTKNNINDFRIDTSGNLSPNLLDPGNSQLYPEFAGTPFGGGVQTPDYKLGANYIDFSNTTQSTGTTSNPVTYAFHYVMFDNDPAIHMYEVVNHSSTDPSTSVGQGQFLMRVDPAKFNTLYQVNTGPNNLGSTTTLLPQNSAQISELNGPNGYGASVTATNSVTHAVVTYNPRKNLNEVLDLNGDSDLQAGLGRQFLNKYDYSSYEQFRQGQTEVGPNYALSSLFSSHDTFTGGPTKQNLQFTDNILMVEFLSGHYGTGSVNPGDPGYSYVPAQGVNSSKLFGPYIFRATPVNGETPSQLYNDAISSESSYPSLYNQDATLISNGYTPYGGRGSLQANISSPVAGWSGNTNNNTVVLSDPKTNFQETHQGYQYWAQLNTNGQATINNVVPGTYRMSVYQYGQWGETRVDGVQVSANGISAPQNVQFTPENFGSSIWTIGTPDRSAHEFLNGHFTSGPNAGQDNRNYFGNYNYWQQEADLGNNGKVVYYATDVGAHPATNDANKWIANQWQKFDPSLYNPATNSNNNSAAGTVGLYPSLAPAYVGDPATYTGAPWEVHFTTQPGAKTNKNFAVLSVGLAGAEGSLIVTLNSHQEIWHYTNNSDPMIRSGLAGYYQWVAFEWPIADLSSDLSDNLLTFSVSTTNGDMYDALRMELTANSADPGVTGWHDYFYVNGSGNNAANADDSIGQTAQNAPEPVAGVILLGLGGFPLLKRRSRVA
ncbi:MAG: polysaccharide lyase family protein [Planctomycetota bacterium]|nr:polysaccharide lyase family protein [Planctomycetota bacterium]